MGRHKFESEKEGFEALGKVIMQNIKEDHIFRLVKITHTPDVITSLTHIGDY